MARQLSRVLLLVLAVPLAASVEWHCTENANIIPGGTAILQRDCLWGRTPSSIETWVGTYSRDPIAITAPAKAPQQPGGAPLKIVNAVLVGFSLPDTAAGANTSAINGVIGRPLGLKAAVDASSLHLQDVRVIVSRSTFQGYLMFFQGLVKTGKAYTDNSTFLHVTWWKSDQPGPLTTWESSGLLVADGLPDVRVTMQPPTDPDPPDASSRNSSSSSQVAYVASSSNSTLVPLLMAYGRVSTPRPLLVYVSTNITLGPGWVPDAGLDLNRPLVLVGLSSQVTSVDLDMSVNQFIMLGPNSNMTMDWLVLENLAPGDERSATTAAASSINVVANVWALLYDRSTMRMTTRNVTMVHYDPHQLSSILYWFTAYNSPLSDYKDEVDYLRNVLKVEAWEMGPVSSTSYNNSTDGLPAHMHPMEVELVEMRTQSSYKFDTLYSMIPQVAPPSRRDPHDEPSGDHHGMPDVVAVHNAEEMLEDMSERPGSKSHGTRRIQLVDGVIVWPSGPSLVLAKPYTLMGNLNQTDLASRAVMDFNYTARVLQLSPDAEEKQLVMQHLLMKGLAQGPGAAAAGGLDNPHVWTMMVWGIHRNMMPAPSRAEYDYVMLGSCQLLLPAPEFDFLRQQSSSQGGRVMLYMTGPDASFGVMMSGMTSLTPDALFVESLLLGSLTALNITLLRDPSAYLNMPGGYFWPSTDGGSGQPQRPAGWVIPVGVVLGGIGAAMCLAALLLVRQKRRRRAPGSLEVGSSSKQARMEEGAGGRGPQEGTGGSPLWVRTRAAIAQWLQNGKVSSSEHRGSDCSVNGAASSNARQGEAACDAAGELSCFGSVPCAAPGAGPRVGSEANRGREQGAAGTVGKGQQHQQLQQQQQPHAMDGLAGLGGGDDVVGSTDVLAGWQRVHGMISTMSHNLQQRRLQASLSVVATGSFSHTGTSGGDSSTQGPGDGADVEQRRLEGSPSSGGDLARGSSSSVRSKEQQLRLISVIGRGTFAMVYRGCWRGAAVAVKVLHLPSIGAGCQEGGGADGAQADSMKSNERMAVMEAVVSTSLSHPHIVQVYTYVLEPLFCGPLSSPTTNWPVQGQGQPAVQPACKGDGPMDGRLVGWELRLLMEYCKEGSLRAALDDRRLVDPATGLPELAVVLALCLDVASAILHLHSEQVLHGDLKASNVLLVQGTAVDGAAEEGEAAAPAVARGGEPAAAAAATGGTSCGEQANQDGPAAVAAEVGSSSSSTGGLRLREVVAGRKSRLVGKVSDFGLSLALETDISHVSHMHGGTLTHMAPELLLHGRASRASDVYAYGVLMWEMLTGQRAFKGIAIALLAHQVAKKKVRPAWPADAPIPPPLKALAEACWDQDPTKRPSVRAIIDTLSRFMEMTPEELATWQGPLSLHPHPHGSTSGGASSSTGTAAISPRGGTPLPAVLPPSPLEVLALDMGLDQLAGPGRGSCTAGCAGVTAVLEDILRMDPELPADGAGEGETHAAAAAGGPGLTV